MGKSSTTATSKIELFGKVVNGFQPLTIITKCSILDVAGVLDPPLLQESFWTLVKKIWCKYIFIFWTQVMLHKFAGKISRQKCLLKELWFLFLTSYFLKLGFRYYFYSCYNWGRLIFVTINFYEMHLCRFRVFLANPQNFASAKFISFSLSYSFLCEIFARLFLAWFQF